eukprot:GHVL01033232.1.p1 GENE.GHVL01033232.1~~GHVL01033232.1.p1  ORF type:complete len:111 (+),score=24.68 GHVL01033232.1:3-335(+)
MDDILIEFANLKKLAVESDARIEAEQAKANKLEELLSASELRCKNAQQLYTQGQETVQRQTDFSEKYRLEIEANNQNRIQQEYLEKTFQDERNRYNSEINSLRFVETKNI